MKEFALIFAVAIIAEALVEYGTTIYDFVEKHEVKKAVKQLCAIVICTVIAFLTNANVFTLLGITFAYPWAGVLLTGILGSRGSNYIADLIKKIENITPATAVTGIEIIEDDEYTPAAAEPEEAAAEGEG